MTADPMSALAEVFDPASPTKQPTDGVWVARYSDGSGISAYRCEVDALRDANGDGREVVFVRWGHDLLRDGERQ